MGLFSGCRSRTRNESVAELRVGLYNTPKLPHYNPPYGESARLLTKTKCGSITKIVKYVLDCTLRIPLFLALEDFCVLGYPQA